MVTVFVNGIPSSSKIVLVEAPPIVLANSTKGVVFQTSFTNTPGAAFLALATTNLSLPLSNWTVLGAPTESSPGHFQFGDPQSIVLPQRFYTVRAQ